MLAVKRTRVVFVNKLYEFDHVNTASLLMCLPRYGSLLQVVPLSQRPVHPSFERV